jgi:hypothetical protein
MKRLLWPLLASLTLGLAPFVPEPHLVGKIRWVAGGAVGMQPMDWLDLAMHAAPFVWLLVTAGLVVRDRRRAVPCFFGGCDVEPFCFDCQEALDAGLVDAGPIDSGRRDAMLPDVGTPDAGDAGCLAAEECNGRDDDCDGNVDEGIDTATDPRNCGECGNVCSPPGAFPVCTGGVCGVGGCDVGFVDLDDDPSNGCEYRCLQRAEDDVVCDLRDDDCDGEVDEDVDTTTDVLNCSAIRTTAAAAAWCAVSRTRSRAAAAARARA